MDLSLAETSLKFRIKYVVENHIQSLTLVSTRISSYCGTPYLHFLGLMKNGDGLGRKWYYLSICLMGLRKTTKISIKE
jgi:hypothetical protein